MTEVGNFSAFQHNGQQIYGFFSPLETVFRIDIKDTRAGISLQQKKGKRNALSLEKRYVFE